MTGNVSHITREILDSIPKPKRVMAPFRWFGGKGKMASKIVPLVPCGKIYVEPYCGAASVFWYMKSPREIEVLNDLNSEIINLFRVLQNKELFDKLAHRLCWTPYSLAEFTRALGMESDDPVDRAWAFFTKQGQGFGGEAKSKGNWGRAFTSSRDMAMMVSIWETRLSQLYHFHDRLTRVQFDNRDALDVIKYWDSDKTVFYLDPPYISDVRKYKIAYRHETTDGHHLKLVELLLSIKGQAALSGYNNDIYKPLENAGWTKYTFKTACRAAGRVRGSNLQGKGAATKHQPRTECLWVKDNMEIK